MRIQKMAYDEKQREPLEKSVSLHCEIAEESVRLHSIQTFGTVDGPGIRTVLFFQGCPFRCSYCHNPDTWSFSSGKMTSMSKILTVIDECQPYYANGGGVTVSGGECLFQADFLILLLQECQKKGIHTAIDTSGMLGRFYDSVKIRVQTKIKVFSAVDLVIMDVKFNSEEQYRKNTSGTLSEVLETLAILQKINKPTWVRQVIIQGINDSTDEILKLKKLLTPFTCIQKVELLPFKKLCTEKYEQLSIDFILKNIPETSQEQIRSLQKYYDSLI